MEIRHLRTLVTVADADSFASAAEQLFITPAAVSQQIRQLEAELGIQLFDRALRPPRLSTHAETLVGRARELVEQFNDFRASARERQVRGRLSIGSVNGITASLLPETLRSLTRRYPEVRVRIEEGSSRQLVRRVKRRELDAAIVSDITDLPDTMERFPVFSEPLVVIENQARGATTWREALKRDPFLRLNKNSGLGSLIDESLKRFRIRVDEAMELDSTDSIVQMTLSGLGSGVVPMGRVSAEASRALRIFPFGEPQVHRQVVLVQRKSNAPSELLRLLYREVQSQIAERS
jgi:DNA-binding transcriptional LysR family regulator